MQANEVSLDGVPSYLLSNQPIPIIINTHRLNPSISNSLPSFARSFAALARTAAGQSEIEMGKAIRDLGWKREDVVVSTKIFFGTRRGPNATGLSRKHLIEGTNASLERMGLEYVDVCA